MRAGTVGSGLMRGKRGTIFARAGHDVVFGYARSPKTLEGLRGMRRNARAGRRMRAHARLTPSCSRRTGPELPLLKHAGDLTGKVFVSCLLPTKTPHQHL
jgi:hypothetical protein